MIRGPVVSGIGDSSNSIRRIRGPVVWIREAGFGPLELELGSIEIT